MLVSAVCGPVLNREATSKIAVGKTLQAFSLEVFVSGWSPTNSKESRREEMKLKSLGLHRNKQSLQSGMTLAWIGCAK